ncbi:MAG TPA: HEAT repeat domain-containing protein [Terriglobales bacterium]|nr:HEAT repeat domain-containing protein [Terriglobales bacterium]
MPEPVFSGASRGLLWLQATAVALALGVLGYNFAGGKLTSLAAGFNTSRNRVGRTVVSRPVDVSVQGEAEQLLTQVATGDSEAADQVLAQSPNWTGKTRRTPTADQQILTALNLPNLHAREAAVQAELALDGVPLSDAGLRALEQAVGNPSQRVWALWMLGALGNRGVDPVHSAKIIEAYLADPEVNVRASAVNGLAILATDETVPMLLDRFRNDPSPIVQERAACGLAESGMYTHEQRMTAAASLVGWLDDSTLSAGQRAWTAQALGDISGKHFGADSTAWRNWYESTR